MPTIYTSEGRSPRYYIRIRVEGKPKEITLGPVTAGLKAAKAAMAKLLAEQNIVRYSSPSSTMTFEKFVEIFRRDRYEDLALSTRTNYDSNINLHLIPFFGPRLVQDIELETVREWMAGLRAKGLSYNTRKICKLILSTILSEAEKLKYLPHRNPCRWVSAGKKEAARPRKLLALDEFERLRATLPPHVLLIVEIAYSTGLRVSEILALRWQDIDPLSGRLIPSGRVYKGEWSPKTKTEDSKRPRSLGKLLPKVLMRRTNEGPESFIFHREDGSFLTYGMIDKAFKRAAEDAGVYYPGLGFHYFRAMYVTYALQVGGSSLEVSKFVGHCDPLTTQIYTMRDEERLRALTEKIQDATGLASAASNKGE